MRHALLLSLAGLTLCSAALGQTSCSHDALADAANASIAIRRQLRVVAVGEDDPAVPPAVATQLTRLKDSLAQAAEAAFRCAQPNADPDELQNQLANALHANLAQASGTVLETRNKKDMGAYGSDLAVQLIPLYSSPKYVEVDFRYGVECGDDNLMMVFQAGGPAGPGWHEVLRWGAASYPRVSGAFGDFVLLTPLSGLPGQRHWRFVVAHGQPECAGADDAPSHFDLDVLEPAADPAQPQVIWHMEQGYRRNEVPSLSTTEDTLTLELRPPEKGPGRSVHAQTFRYRLGKDDEVVPLTAGEGETPSTATASGTAAKPASASTNSPQ